MRPAWSTWKVRGCMVRLYRYSASDKPSCTRVLCPEWCVQRGARAKKSPDYPILRANRAVEKCGLSPLLLVLTGQANPAALVATVFCQLITPRVLMW